MNGMVYKFILTTALCSTAVLASDGEGDEGGDYSTPVKQVMAEIEAVPDTVALQRRVAEGISGIFSPGTKEFMETIALQEAKVKRDREKSMLEVRRDVLLREEEQTAAKEAARRQAALEHEQHTKQLAEFRRLFELQTASGLEKTRKEALLAAEIEALRQRESETLLELDGLRQSLATTRGEVEELTEDLGVVRGEASALSAELGDTKGQLAAIEDQKAKAEQSLDEKRAAMRLAAEKMTALTEALSRNQAEVARLTLEKQQLAARNELDGAARAELAGTVSDYSSLIAQLTRALSVSASMGGGVPQTPGGQGVADIDPMTGLPRVNLSGGK